MRPGRLIRQQMADDAKDGPGRVAERLAMRQAGELAVKAREARYPALTPENAGEAMAYQESVLRQEQARLLGGRS